MDGERESEKSVLSEQLDNDDDDDSNDIYIYEVYIIILIVAYIMPLTIFLIFYKKRHSNILRLLS